MPISFPEDYPHPIFSDQREYELRRIVVDTGGEGDTATVELTFRNQKTGVLRRFRFKDVQFAHGMHLTEIRSPYIYVATTAGRGWAGASIEVGDTDPGGEWFWAEEIEEIN